MSTGKRASTLAPVSNYDVLDAGCLSVWVVASTNDSEIQGKICVFIEMQVTELGDRFVFYVPGEYLLRTLPPKNLTKIDHDPAFPYTGTICEKVSWLESNKLNGAQYPTDYTFNGLF